MGDELSVDSKDSRNKRKSGDLSSDEESKNLNPEKKHEGTKTFFPMAAAPPAAAGSASASPTWPPTRDPNRPLPPLPGQQQIYDKIAGESTNSSGQNQLPSGAFKAPSNKELIDVCVRMSQELGQDDQGGTGGTGAPETFASKAKKAKRFFPYTVFIVSGENSDESLDKRHYVAFQEFIWQARIKLTFEENEKVKIEWMQFHGTYGMVACDDKDTARWVRSKAQVFKFEEKSTRSYFQWERQESVVYGVFLKGPMFRQKQMKPNWALGQIFKANNLVGEFRNVSWDTKRNPGGVYLEFEPCGQDLITRLDGMSSLNCLTCKPTLNKRVRKAKTEEEFLAGLQKDPQFKAQNLTVDQTYN
jgi:hypothetical protein